MDAREQAIVSTFANKLANAAMFGRFDNERDAAWHAGVEAALQAVAIVQGKDFADIRDAIDDASGIALGDAFL